jgi:disulfide bond formation protein DsbB
MASFFKTIKNIPSPVVAGLTAIFCAFLLASAFILETFVALAPCPLCIAQRFFFVLIGLVAVILVWWPRILPKGVAGVKIAVYSLLGGAIASRQVWMQWHPQNIDPTRCGVSFGTYIDQFGPRRLGRLCCR